FFSEATIGTSSTIASQRLICTAWKAAVVAGYASGFFVGCSFVFSQSRPVVFVWAQVCICFRSARLVGAVACFEIRTPWLALKYGVEKSTVRLRWAVIVASWKEMSNFFVPGAKRS